MTGKNHKSIKSARSVRQGFTITEVSIATAFISILLIAISAVTINVTSIYTKGNTIKAVNSAGSAIISDMTAALETSRFSSADFADRSHYARSEKRRIGINNSEVPAYGVFCSGNYSYLWNSGYAIRSNTNKLRIKYSNTTGEGNSKFRLLKILDPNRSACTNFDANNNRTTVSKTKSASSPTELLSDSDANLALYNLTPTSVATDPISSQVLISMTFVLATVDGDIDIISSGDYCQQTTANSDYERCAVNRFSFTTRSAGSTT